VSYLSEPMAPRQGQFQFLRKTLINFYDHGTTGADEMMMMVTSAFLNEFETSGSIPKVEPPDQSHIFERVQVAIDRREVTSLPAESGMNFPIGHRVLVASEHFQNGLSRTRDFARMLPQLVREFGQRLLHESVRMLMLAARGLHEWAGFSRARRT